jgi:hypothetical protein
MSHHRIGPIRTAKITIISKQENLELWIIVHSRSTFRAVYKPFTPTQLLWDVLQYDSKYITRMREMSAKISTRASRDSVAHQEPGSEAVVCVNVILCQTRIFAVTTGRQVYS